MKDQKKAAHRPVDVYLDKFNASHQNPANKLIRGICVPLIVFSLIGLCWAAPFPYIKFLSRYNGFLNWASFFIAFSIYYYYKLSPVLSYLVLLMVFALTYGVIELDAWHKTGGPALWAVCLVVFIASLTAQLIGRQMEGKKSSIANEPEFLLIGPIWLLHFILKRFSIKY